MTIVSAFNDDGTEQVTVRLNKEIAGRLKKLAERRGQPLTRVVRDAIADHLSAEIPPEGKPCTAVRAAWKSAVNRAFRDAGVTFIGSAKFWDLDSNLEPELMCVYVEVVREPFILANAHRLALNIYTGEIEFKANVKTPEELHRRLLETIQQKLRETGADA